MEQTTEILLYAGKKTSVDCVLESLLAYYLDDGLYKLAVSPAFVLGIASGDIIKIIDSQSGTFEIIERGGNLSIQVFCENEDAVDIGLTPQIIHMGGVLDGKNKNVLVYTIPVTVGFQKIESVLDNRVSKYSRTKWYYGNVYDEKDGIILLNWW